MATHDARSVLRQAGLSPKKTFGQNFLVSPHAIEAIANACIPQHFVGQARVVELGAGTGVLTRMLAMRARCVTAVERDRDLIPVLHSELADLIESGRTLHVLEADAQQVSPADLLGEFDPASPRVLCGNLPYQITGSLIERAVNLADHVDRVVFMMQLEVADRLIASPGTKTYGALSVFTQAAFRVSKLFHVSAGSFFPAPEVTSAVVLFEPERPRRATETDVFRALVKKAFAMRRKTLRNAWGDIGPRPSLEQASLTAGISLDARGETLSVDDFSRVAHALEETHRSSTDACATHVT